MRGQVKIHQKKLAARRRRRAFLLTLYAVAAAGGLFCLLSYISQLDALSISSVVVEGNDRLSSSTVEMVARKELVGNYASFFSRENIFIYPKSKIRADILALPLVKSAEVSVGDNRTLRLALSERQETALWCSDAPSEAALNCYSVDGDGFVFAPELSASVATSTGELVYRGLVTGDPVGHAFLKPADFRKIAFFMSELSGLSVEPREVDLTSSSADASSTPLVYMTVVLGGGGTLVIDTADDLSSVLRNIAAIVSDKAIAPDLPKFLSELDYMKLDVGNKVVYKMRH